MFVWRHAMMGMLDFPVLTIEQDLCWSWPRTVPPILDRLLQPDPLTQHTNELCALVHTPGS
jgi:hypothetical protein